MIQLKHYLSILILFIGINGFSQTEPFYKSYDWDTNPTYKINTSDSTEIITYKDKIVIEFFFLNDNELTEYEVEHKILWLNSDQEIERNNKIYLPYSSSTELLVNKARVITKEGKVINLDDSKILTAEDEETKRVYKYFTFEGVEKGSFVEYLYVIKKYPSYKGRREFFQTNHPKLNIDFDLFSPANLVFEFKSYNGLDSIKIDTNVTEKLHWELHIDSMPLLEEEIQAPYNAYRQYLIYKLDRNITSGIYDISSYGKVAENAYGFLFNNETKTEIKGIKKFLKSSEADLAKDEKTKVRTLEDYIKKTIYQVEGGNNELSDINSILDNKIANKTGLLKLYARLFKLMGIKNQMVMTCDRNSIKFDKDFEANNFLSDYLYYFPNLKSFLSPSDISSRIGFPPFELTNNYGLFIKEISMDDFNTGIGKIKFIDPVKYNDNYDNILIDLKFNDNDLTKTDFNIDRAVGGYYASYIQPFIHLLDEKTKTELIEAQVKFLNEDIEIIDKTVYNDNAESFGIKPFRVNANINTDAFVEKAGNKYLFKIGELIGPQMEMYQEKKRILPAETDFGRTYHRVITFTIPDNYKINNLNNIEIDKNYSKDGETQFKFISSYKVEGTKVIVTVDEYYKIIEIAPDIYEEYRKVINGAADFNKIKLILEPK